ncbi:hypothetical protein FisN_17Lh193 [Fistulifera solaris]|uniref:GOLD domain-containing protein n=1 Tax=Fistulifera solaris TaxID=1519565 RepID=A0A1Z5JDP1_FISSO|nr:hypothetical protein FisN_17Lh193 [Fistulifera solaris]|eukprot:GAX11898.1 hypothetical protein FisN_17Lh193 [Fistulifera solaris]
MKFFLLTNLFITIPFFSSAWLRPSPPQRRTTLILSASLKESPQADQMREDIEEMRKEALKRLEALEHQMETMQNKQSETKGRSELPTKTPKSNPPPMVQSHAFFEAPVEKQTLPILEEQKKELESVIHAPLDLLEDTRWKIAFNIGREKGTWMPPEWGASGDRLRFQVVLDFTPEFTATSDEFFMASSAPTKVCKVVDGFVFPSGVGSHSVGRQALPADATGIYQVARGQGPAGTDILRFYITLDEDLTFKDHKSDVVVPAGRIYGTCGYFSTSPHSHAVKDLLAKHYHDLVMQYETLQQQMDNDTRLFSIEHVKRLKEQWSLRKRIESAAKDVERARQKDPERSQLRLSSKGNVALTKDGGVCCKTVKGVAIEYRILGKMEVGCMGHRDNNSEDEDAKKSPRLHP